MTRNMTLPTDTNKSAHPPTRRKRTRKSGSNKPTNTSAAPNPTTQPTSPRSRRLHTTSTANHQATGHASHHKAKPRARSFVFTLCTKATFVLKGGAHRWTSEMASAKVAYLPEKDDIKLVEVYKQRHKVLDQWAKPYFDEGAMTRLLDAARTRWDRIVNGTKGPTAPRSGGRLKGHEIALCERCCQLRAEGRSRGCVGQSLADD